MAEEEETVAIGAGLGNVKVAANQGYQERVEQIVQKLIEDLGSLPSIGLRTLLVFQSRRLEPVNIGNLLGGQPS